MTTAHALKQSKVFGSLSDEILDDLKPQLETSSIQAGEVLIRQGDSGSDYFHLVSGRLRVFSELANGKLKPLSEIYPGEGVGEMSLITGEPRSATVIARLDSEVIRVTQAALLKLIERKPEMALELARLVTSRLALQQRQTTKSQTIAILALNEGVDSDALAHGLAGQLENARVLAGPEPNREMEKTLNYAIYAAGHLDTAWARLCFLHVDVVVLAVNAAEEAPSGLIDLPFPPGVDRSLFGKIHLLMVHPQEWKRGCETAAWIARLNPEEYHHARAGNRKDLARLARILTGRAVNLVLSGGGARAFSQLGVLKAFRQAGITFDRAAGSSMGAFVAAAYSYDGDFENMIARMKEGLVHYKPDRDFTLPMLSLLRGKRLQEFGASICGDWRIEDLPRRYFCLSSCLNDGEIVPHFDGVVMTALRASCAFPVLGPPLLIDGKLLIDGGVLNNLPIDLMKRHFTGSVTAIDISAFAPLKMDSRWDRTCPSGFDIFWNKVKPFSEALHAPNILEILARTLDLTCRAQIQRSRQLADWLIEPPVLDCGLTDFGRFDEMVEIGYRHGLQLIEEITTNRELAKTRGVADLL
jgi:NTE family protein